MPFFDVFDDLQKILKIDKISNKVNLIRRQWRSLSLNNFNQRFMTLIDESIFKNRKITSKNVIVVKIIIIVYHASIFAIKIILKMKE